MDTTKIIVVNCGSSSIKLAKIDPEEGRTEFSLLAECLNHDQARIIVKKRGRASHTIAIPNADHLRTLEALHAEWLGSGGSESSFSAVGHRVVHGGEYFKDSTRIDPRVVRAIETCIPLAPLHNPSNLTGIRLMNRFFPDMPHVAVFDTAFHQTIPQSAWCYAVPFALYSEHGVRRYGFHGTSYRYVVQETALRMGKQKEDLDLIVCHLGNGSSVCAVSGGASVNTTMGLTPLEGIVMGSRSGDVDPNLFDFLNRKCGYDIGRITSLLNRESGLLGLSGISHDMREILRLAGQGHVRARLALDVFCFRLAKGIWSMCTGLKKLDALVFTGGIGENAVEVRSQTMNQLSLLGARLDPAANAISGRASNGLISGTQSLPVYVIPTNEELMIARDTFELMHS